MIYRNLQVAIGGARIPSGLILLIAGVILIALGRANQTAGRKSSKELSHILLGIVLPISIIFLLIGAGFYLFSSSKATTETVNAYPLFRDILQIVLAIAAVAIAALGYLIYRIVAQRLQIRAEEEIGNERRRIAAKLCSDIGLLRWRDFERITPPNPQYRQDAIDMTEKAHRYASELDERDPRNERIIAAVRNNLAWYFANRGRSQDRGKARGYAQYIHARSQNFPEEKEEWEDTYREVMRVYP